jgi:predicted acyltransferase
MSSSQPRFLALDVFRGMTVCFMIIVNTPGNYETTFAPLLHAQWHGFTPTDLVFPSFLFAVGNAMSFVMNKWQNMPSSKVLGKILKRTVIIFLLGYLMYWFPFFTFDEYNHLILKPISETRIFGVLQRIALTYGITACLLYFLGEKRTLFISIFILLAYWIVLLVFGDADNPFGKHGNAVLKLDLWLIGSKHLYMGEGFPFDPEGLLSTFPAIVNVAGGYFAGKFLQQKGKTYEALAKLLLVGFLLLAIAHFWNYVFPINKKLWTSSFVLHTIALDCMLLAAVVYLIDFQKRTKWTYFFEVFGKNPLFIYLLSELLIVLLYMIEIQPGVSVYSWLFLNIFSYATPYVGSLLQAVFYMLICWSVGYWLDKKRIYIKV